jgi:hypothetical protein
MATAGPVDGVLSLRRSTVLLVGGMRGGQQFLTDDHLVVVDTRRLRARARIVLPRYMVPPSLAELHGGRSVAVVVDDRVLLLRAADGQVTQRWHLDMQAVGWPAAMASVGNRLYLAGQPSSSSMPTARLEALEIGDKGNRLRTVWKTSLGLTHAGIWLGAVGPNMIAAYLPDAHDLAGYITAWDVRNGALLGSYTAPGPTLAADPRLDRLYGSVGGRVYARSLSRGAPVIERTGTGPMAADPERGLLLFARGTRIMVLSARTMSPIGAVRLAGARAIGLGAGGSALYVGLSSQLVRVNLASCHAS